MYFDLATWHLNNTVYAPARVAELARMKSFYADPQQHVRLMTVVNARLGHALMVQAEAAKIARKIWDLRILDDEKSASDVGSPILVVSQFTLYGDARRGRRPSWTAASGRPHAEPLVDRVVELLREAGAHVETGQFGAMMRVSSVNDGPLWQLEHCAWPSNTALPRVTACASRSDATAHFAASLASAGAAIDHW